MAETDERDEELESLAAIFPELVNADDREQGNRKFSLELGITPSAPLVAHFMPEESHLAFVTNGKTYAKASAIDGNAIIERRALLAHLPPLRLELTLPASYPASSPPSVHLTTEYDWLPTEKLAELEGELAKIWEDYGGCQILYVYIDYLQQAAERGFDLDQNDLHPSALVEEALLAFNENTKLAAFNAGTYDCGVCLEPKKGSVCYKMKRCAHVFCKDCLGDFYNNAINEGDVAVIRCLDPDCSKDPTVDGKQRRRKKSERTLHPRELLAMGIEESTVRRYVEMKRKKKVEADKTTVYCPRAWCQSPARSAKYPPIPADLHAYISSESDSLGSDSEGAASTLPESPRNISSNTIPPDPNDRLAICSACTLAFCRVCYAGWHGPYTRCNPRDPSALSAEEKASYDYIRLHTSPCPTCSSPTQKTMGCNHMRCFQCGTHFCYLCGAWLDQHDPYKHFNREGTECFQRLWELEEGDEGQEAADGRGFGGARRWEQVALEVAREADEAELAEQADAGQHDQVPAVAGEVAQMQMFDGAVPAPAPDPPPPRHGGRRQRNPFAGRPPGQANAQAVRNHERAQNNNLNGHGNAAVRERGGGARRGPAPALNFQNEEEEARQQELQRFLEMAQRDEEDGWDSDELGDEEGWEIR